MNRVIAQIPFIRGFEIRIYRSNRRSRPWAEILLFVEFRPGGADSLRPKEEETNLSLCLLPKSRAALHEIIRPMDRPA